MERQPKAELTEGREDKPAKETEEMASEMKEHKQTRAQCAWQPTCRPLLSSSSLYLKTHQLTQLCTWLVPVPSFALSI